MVAMKHVPLVPTFAATIMLTMTASAAKPKREGFTLELGLGAAVTTISPDEGDSQTEFGLAPLSLSLGGFLSPDAALMFRLAGTSYFEDFLGETVQLCNCFYGGVVQYWPSDAFFLGGGVGIALFDDNPLFSNVDVEGESAFGMTARAGWAFYASRAYSFALVYEVFPAFYDSVTVVGQALNLQYQYF